LTLRSMISYIKSQMWPKLSEDLRKSDTLNKFKSPLRTLNFTELISENCINSLFCNVLTNLALDIEDNFI